MRGAAPRQSAARRAAFFGAKIEIRRAAPRFIFKKLKSAAPRRGAAGAADPIWARRYVRRAFFIESAAFRRASSVKNSNPPRSAAPPARRGAADAALRTTLEKTQGKKLNTKGLF